MLPYILAAVGGYLIGQSQKKDAPQMAKGGSVDTIDYDKFLKAKVNDYRSQGYDVDESIDTAFRDLGLETNGRFNKIKLDKVLEKSHPNLKKQWKEYKKESEIYVKDGDYVNPFQYEMMADGGMMAKGGKIPEKEVESLKRYTLKWYGKDGMDDDDDADFKPPVTQKEVEDAVSEYVRFCKKAMSEGNESKWGGGDSFDREVVADIMQYNRNPEADTFFYPELIKEIKNIDGKMPMMYAKGGKTKSKKFEFQVMFYDGSGDLIDSEYYVDDPSDKEVIQLAKKLDAKTGQLYRDKYESGEYMELVADYDFIDEYAKGGKVKSKKWIQDALGGDEGSLRRTAKRKGLLKGDENLSMTDLKKLQKMGGKTAKRAHLAETLRKFDDGGMTDYYEDLRVYVQGVGTIYKGNSLSEATDVFDEYYANNPHAEMVMVDEKYGDEIKWANTSSTDDNDD